VSPFLVWSAEKLLGMIRGVALIGNTTEEAVPDA